MALLVRRGMLQRVSIFWQIAVVLVVWAVIVIGTVVSRFR